MGLFKNRKSPKQEYCWTFLSQEGQIVLTEETFQLPLSDVIIIKKCMEFFDDPDPCYIHRSAVMNRLYFEIDKAAGNLTKKEKLLIRNLPGNVSEYLKLPESAVFVLVTWIVLSSKAGGSCVVKYDDCMADIVVPAGSSITIDGNLKQIL